MKTETTFFSYARADSVFALQLARDLRGAGADVWLDQLDIKSGSRWDLAIETALKGSTKTLIILSPDSVASTNVMDEVSFALEQGRTVVPVLFKPCEIPFRLRRLQHADFTISYEKGFEDLLLGLNLEKVATVTVAPEIKVAERTIDPNFLRAEIKTTQERPSNPVHSGHSVVKRYKMPLIAAGITIFLATTVWIVYSLNHDSVNFEEEEIKADPGNSLEVVGQLTANQEALKPAASSEQIASIPEVSKPEKSTEPKKSVKATVPVSSVKLKEPEPELKPEPVQTVINQQEIKDDTPLQEPPKVEEIQKLAETEKSLYDLTGRWRTDDNMDWKIDHTENVVKITFYDKLGKPINEVEGSLSGNILYYRQKRTGNDLEGQFLVSKDGKTLDGSPFKISGVKNNYKVHKMQ